MTKLMFSTERLLSAGILSGIIFGMIAFYHFSGFEHNSTATLALLTAIKESDLSAAQQALASGADPDAVSADSWTPLAWAIHKNNPELVELLLTANVNTNSAQQRLSEVIYCHATIVDNLLRRGLNVQGLVLTGEIPLDNVVLLCQYGARIDGPLLTSIIMRGNTAIARELAGKCVNVNYRFVDNSSGWRLPLDKDVLEKREYSPLSGAIFHDDTELAERLIESGANINQRDARGRTPLLSGIAMRCSDHMLTLFNKHGYDFNLRDNNGMNSLLAAAFNGDVRLVRYLLSHGIDLNSRNNNGDNALFYVLVSLKRNEDTPTCYNYYKNQMLPFLIEQGIRVQVPNHQGITPIRQARLYGLADIEALLIAAQ